MTLEVSVLGQRVHAVTMGEISVLIGEAIGGRHKIVVANHNLHSVYLAERSPRMRQFFDRADVIHFDSMPLVAYARLLGHSVARHHRTTYLDLLPPLLSAASEGGWKVFYLGGKPGVAAEAASILERQHEGLQLETHHGYFDHSRHSSENAQVLERIRDFGTNLLLVGMGMPLQEHWIEENADLVHANAILTAGACFDYVAGDVPAPPRWAGQIGLEWLFRLAAEPKRLAKRYLIEPWFLVPLAIRDIAARTRLK